MRSKFCDKTVAYVDRSNDDEIIEIEDVDVLPRRGQPVRIQSGEAKGNWRVWDVRPLNDAEFSAIVLVDRVDW